MLKKPNPKAVITPCAKPYVNEDGTVEEARENEFELQEKIPKKESMEDEIGNQKEILNIDSLHNTYKQEAVDQNKNEGKYDFENDSDEKRLRRKKRNI